MTEFTERYKKMPNSDLLEILSNSSIYKPSAVETAKEEIASRQLSEIDLTNAKLENESKQQSKQKETEERKHKKDKLKETAYTFFDAINPIHSGIQTPEKIIRLTSLLFGGISIYRIFQQSGMLHFMFTESGGKWDLSMAEYFFPLIILPLAIILFWKRKKIGWVLLSIFLTYSAVNVIGLFFMNLGRQPSGIPALETMFPTVSPISYLVTLLFFGGTLWLISKDTIRDVFQVTKKTMNQTIGITIIVNVIYLYSVMG